MHQKMHIAPEKLTILWYNCSEQMRLQAHDVRRAGATQINTFPTVLVAFCCREEEEVACCM